MTDFNLDDLLDLEKSFYEKGFKEGQEQSAREQFLEGKVYGLQTGFQRFIIVGYLEGLYSGWSKIESASLKPHLKQLRKYLDEISPSNEADAVARYEKAVSGARNKARVIAAITKTSDKIARLDELIKDVGGKLQVSDNLNEMW